MSYILDALKKADQKRKLGVIPGLRTDHGALVNIEQRPRFSPRLIALGAAGLFLLLNIALWLWWSKPWQVEQPRVVAPVAQPQPVVSPARENSPPAAPSAPDESRRQDASMEPPQSQVTPSAPPVAVPEEPVTNEEMDAPVLSYPEEPIAAPVSPDKTEGVGRDAVTPDEAGEQSARVMALAELPNHIQQALPQIQISLHFFSNRPEARLVRINDRHLHEGDIVANELRLLEITEGGAVFSFRGYRFQVEKL